MRNFVIFLLSMIISASVFSNDVTIGDVHFPLGTEAFPFNAELAAGNDCHSYTIGYGCDTTLIGHDLNIIAKDVESENIIRLDFKPAIKNLPGPDVYIGQALGPEPINRFSHAKISVDGVMYRFIDSNEFWFTGVNGFVALHSAQAPERYQLKAATIDLSDLGIPKGVSVDSLYLRGVSVNSGGGSNWGTNYAVVGNLNGPERVELVNPYAYEYFRGQETIRALVFAEAVINVIFMVDDEKVCIDRSPPFYCDFDSNVFSNGLHQFKAIVQKTNQTRVIDKHKSYISNSRSYTSIFRLIGIL